MLEIGKYAPGYEKCLLNTSKISRKDGRSCSREGQKGKHGETLTKRFVNALQGTSLDTSIMDECDKPSHFVLKTCAEQELTPLGQDEVLDMEVDNETRDLVKAAAAVTTTNTLVTNTNTDVSSTTKTSTSQPGHSLRK